LPASILPRTKEPVKGLLPRVAAHELLFLVLLSPLFLFPGPWTPAAAGAVVVLWVVRLAATGRPVVSTPLDGALTLLFLSSLVGLLISPSLDLGMARFWAIFLGLALVYALVAGLDTSRALRVATDLFVVAGLGLALVTLLGSDWLHSRMAALPIYESLPLLLRDPAGGDLFNPRVMGMALAVLVPLPLSVALWRGPAWRRPVAAFVALVMVAVLVLTQALQALLGLLAALVVLAVWRSRWCLLAIPAGLALLWAAILVYGPQQLAVDLLSIDHPLGVAVVLRLDMWSRAWAMVRDLPFTGIGLDVFPLIQSNFYPGFLIGPEPHAHSLYLQLALDLGLPGLVAFLWLALFFGWTAVRAGRAAGGIDRALLAGTTAGVAAYLAAGFMDTPWATKPGVLLWVLLGAGTAVALRLRPELRPAGARRFAPLAGLAVVLGLSLLLLPGLAARNLGSILAHKSLAAAQAGGEIHEAQVAQAASLLERGAQWQPDHSQSLRTLGRLYAWLGQQESAIQVLERSVDLDLTDPMARYAPWLPPLRRLTGQEPPAGADDLAWVYGHWSSRYPQRAEGFALLSLVWAEHKDDPDRARAIVQSGLDAGAEPADLLTYYSSLLASGP
jgi:putative inorganic carbon (hco3(-)) transporter